MPDEKLGTKKDYGVNGNHTQLGKEFSMAEFKGFTIATMNEIKERMQRMDDYYSRLEEKTQTRIKDCEDSVEGIDKWKSNMEGKIAVLMVIFTAVGSTIGAIVISGLKKIGGI